MDQNERQARWILAQNWLSKAQLRQPYSLAKANRTELCGLLIQYGLITPMAAQRIRNATQDSPATNLNSSLSVPSGQFSAPGSPLNHASAQLPAVSFAPPPPSPPPHSPSGTGPLQVPGLPPQSLNQASGQLPAVAPNLKRTSGQLRAVSPPLGHQSGQLPAIASPLGQHSGQLPAVNFVTQSQRQSKPRNRPGTERLENPAVTLERQRREQEKKAQALTASARADVEGFAKMRAANKSQRRKRTFANYQLLEELGRGAMGVVMKAQHLETKKVVALKFMQDKTKNKRAIKRFQKEARVLIKVSHPNIIEISDFGNENGVLFFAMEFIEGEDLRAKTKKAFKRDKKAIDWRDLLRIMTGVARALKHCAEQNIVHRDVKPGNILLENDSGRPLLVDFGLLKEEEEEAQSSSRGSQDSSAIDSHNLTKTNEAVGTPAFMAPEQFMYDGSFGKVGPKTDVWGWAVSFYYALTGEAPFREATVVDTFRAILKKSPRKIRDYNSDVPDWIIDIISDCMIRQTSKRLSIEQLLERLELAEANTQRKRLQKTVIGVVAVVLCLLLIVFMLAKPDPAVALFSQPNPATSSSKSVIKGKFNRPDLKLFFNKSPVTLSSSGVFSIPVELVEGDNPIELTYEQGSTFTDLFHSVIVRDSTPPKLSFEAYDPESKITRVDNDRLTGQLNDVSLPGTVIISGREVQTDKSGHFEIPVELHDAPQKILSVTVRDALKNSSEHSVKAVSPSAYHGIVKRRKFLQPLQNLKSWKAADEATQDAVIAFIATQLGANFKALEPRTYACGRQKFRIGRFKHQKSNLTFHLIPGGVEQRRWWLNPVQAYDSQLMQTVARDDKVEWLRRVFHFLYENPLTFELTNYIDGREDFRTKVVSRFKLNRKLEIVRRNWSKILKLERAAKGKIRGNAARHLRILNKEIRNDIRAYFSVNPQLKEQLKEFAKRQLKKLLSGAQFVDSDEVIEPMLVSDTEVCVKAWRLSGGYMDRDSKYITDSLPILVRWKHLTEWLNAQGCDFRLPTVAEWQHLARAGSASDLPWDNEQDTKKYAWVLENSKMHIHPVDKHSERRNAFGLADTIGNAEEWAVEDWERWAQLLGPERLNRVSPAFRKQLKLTLQPGMGGSSTTPSPHVQVKLLNYRTKESIRFTDEAVNYEPQESNRRGIRVVLSIPNRYGFSDKR